MSLSTAILHFKQRAGVVGIFKMKIAKAAHPPTPFDITPKGEGKPEGKP